MKERGEALLETVLIAPVLLMVGLMATEFGASALRRAQLSEGIRSAINLELVNAQDGEAFQDGRQIKAALTEKLKELPALDKTHPLEIEVVLLDAPGAKQGELPFKAFQGDLIESIKSKTIRVRVKAYSKTLFYSFLKLPPLDDTVTHRLRG